MERIKKAWINLILLGITLAVNALGAFGVINGMSQKAVSDMYITLITPSPSTFSIWSVIYILLFISLITMIVKKEDPYYKRAIDEISTLFWITCFLNVAWIVLFSFIQIGISSIFIFAFVIVLAIILKKLEKIKQPGKWLLPLTFGLYTGWLVIATVVNISAWLVKINWQGFGMASDIWAIITLIVAVGIVYLIITSNKNAVFPLPVAWAYLGIYQFLNSPEGFQGRYKMLQMIALAGMVVLIGIAAIQFYKNRFRILPRE
ncbi:MAG: TspO/MBR family protein [Clostridia bacterium]